MRWIAHIFLIAAVLRSFVIAAGIESIICYPYYNLIDISQDTIKDRQQIYSGLIWTNKFRRFSGDQFLFSNLFLPGSVSSSGMTCNRMMIRYDIYSDEIHTPLNRQDIIQLNKEMIDSFSLTFQNQEHRFIHFQNDSLSGLNGFFEVLHNGESSVYIKHYKELSTYITDKSDGEFIGKRRIYVVSGGRTHLVNRTSDLAAVYGDHAGTVKEYINRNRLKVTVRDPESIVSVINFLDTLK